MDQERSATPSTRNSLHLNHTFNKRRFLILESSVACFTIAILYLLVALIIYEFKRASSRTFKGPKGILKKTRTRRYALAMRIESLLAVWFLLGRNLCEHYELVAQYVHSYTYDYCNVIVNVKFALTALSIISVYMFLWTRQRFCYSDPAMAHLISRTTKVVSWLSFGLLWLAQVVGTLLFTTTRVYVLTWKGCQKSHTTIPDYIPWIWLAGATISCQILLLGLFIFPLVKHRSLVQTRSGKKSKSFLPIIQRAAFTSCACVVTDLLGSLIILLIKDRDDLIPTMVYDITSLINLFCIVLAFRDWRPRLFSPFVNINETSHDISSHEGRRVTASKDTLSRTWHRQFISAVSPMRSDLKSYENPLKSDCIA